MRGQVKVVQKQIQARRRRRIAYLSAGAVSALVLSVFGLGWFSQAGFMAVSEVEVSGASRVSPESVVAIADSEMAGSYLGLFSRRNVLLYPKGAIRDAVAALPAVQEVGVERDGFRTVAISLVERVEEARWCSDGEGTEESVGCFSIDEDGLIFDRSQGSLAVAYRGAPNGNPIGTQVAPREDFRRTQFFVRQLVGLSVDPREVRQGGAGYVDVLLGGGGTLIVNTADDLSATLANLSAVLADRSVAPSPAAFLLSLDYMRLDSGNKVFYKLKP